MSELVYSLGIGIPLIIITFFVLYRFSPLKGAQVSLMLILAIIAIYFPYGIIHWKGLDVFAIHIAMYFMTAYGLGIITYNKEKRENAGEINTPQKLQWPPVLIISFFILLAGIDAVLITVAEKGLGHQIAQVVLPDATNKNITSFFPGTVSHDFQEKEKLFNAYLEQRKLQEERAWKIRKGWLGKAYASQENPLQVEVLDKDNQPVEQAQVEAIFWRAANKDLDQNFLLEEVEPGLYRSDILLEAPGCWYIVLNISKADAFHEVRASTWLEPMDEQIIPAIDTRCINKHEKGKDLVPPAAD